MVDAVVLKNANFPLITWSNTSHTDEKREIRFRRTPTCSYNLNVINTISISQGDEDVTSTWDIGPSNWQNNSLPAPQTPTALGTPSRPTEDLSAPAASQTQSNILLLH